MTKITVVTSFPIHPPRGGGQQRIFGLYSALARRGVEVDVVALVNAEQTAATRTIAPGVREIRVPKSARHNAAEFELNQRAGVPATDLALALHHDLTPEYAAAIGASAARSEFVVASQPFGHPAIAAAGVDRLVHESHNVELDLKRSMLTESPAGRELLELVREVEGACCRDAEHTLVCAARDAERLDTLYNLDAEQVVVVPNGVDEDAVSFVGSDQRSAAKARLGLQDEFLVLFLGSWHEPNVVAVRDLLGAAEALPGLRFLIVGSVGMPFAEAPRPDNVDFCGLVPSPFVTAALGIADLAVNPMRLGSGTNLKMLDYALAGVPLASSEFGARGLAMSPGVHYAAIDCDRLAEGIAEVPAEAPPAIAARVHAAAAHVRATFTWPVIVDAWLAHPAFAHLRDQAVPA